MFLDPRLSDENGIVALGPKITVETLKLAYSQGIFPWPIDGLPTPWFCPPQRAILEFDSLHISRSVRRAARNPPLDITFDRAFRNVITECARCHAPSWITRELLEGYVALHEQGWAHSVEAWRDGQLVGGVYGVDAGGAFACESMFYLEPNASKLCLLRLFDHLKSRGAEWVDIQMLTPHMERFGAREISRDDFLSRLSRTQARGLKLF